MNLQNIRINDRLIQETATYISTQNYATLRTHCLEKKAIQSILDSIANDLKPICEDDKNETEIRVRDKFLILQKQQDFAENQSDTDEANRDIQLKVTLEAQKNELARRIEQEKSELERVKSERANLDLQIRICANSLTFQEANIIAIQDPYFPRYYHRHPSRFVGPSNGLALNQCLLLIATDKQLKSREEELRDSLPKLQQQRQNVESEIEIAIPNRQNKRDAKLNARNYRNLARCSHDVSFNQLTEANRRAMVAEISSEKDRLDQNYADLNRQAKDLSYITFLKQLEGKVTTMTYLLEDEKTATLKIIKKMNEYLSKLAEKHDEENRLNDAKRALNDLENQLSSTENKLKELQHSVPATAEWNERLKRENIQLQQEIDKRRILNNKLLISGSVLLVASVTAIVLPLFVLAAPALPLFVVGAIIGAIALSLFIAAIVYAVSNAKDKRKVEKNLATIDANMDKMSRETVNAQTLDQSTIPKLHGDISLANTEVNKISERVEVCQIALSTINDDAERISWEFKDNNRPRSPGFFQPFPARESFAPSAPLPPPSYDDVMNQGSGLHR